MKVINPPMISVIMGVYNDESYLKDAIDSILCQTYSNFEFIICNDCSTNEIVSTILNEYADKDNRIKIITNKINSGLAQSLNNCLSIAKGKYIARMDSDDKSLPNRFEIELEFLEKNPNYVACGARTYYIDKNNKRYKVSPEKKQKTISFDSAVNQSCLIHPTVMILKSALDDVNNYTVNKYTFRAEDYDLWCKLTYKGYKLTNLPDILFEYREDIDGFKKRKYKYRIQESMLKYKWLKKSKRPFSKYYYAIRPLLVGLIPANIMKKIKRR